MGFQFSSVAQSCPTLCDPMNRSTPGLPVHHHLPEFTQTHNGREFILLAFFKIPICAGTQTHTLYTPPYTYFLVKNNYNS